MTRHDPESPVIDVRCCRDPSDIARYLLEQLDEQDRGRFVIELLDQLEHARKLEKGGAS